MAAPRRLFCNIIVLRTIVAGQDTSALCFVCTFLYNSSRCVSNSFILIKPRSVISEATPSYVCFRKAVSSLNLFSQYSRNTVLPGEYFHDDYKAIPQAVYYKKICMLFTLQMPRLLCPGLWR